LGYYRDRPTQEARDKFDVDALTLLIVKTDVMTQRLDRLNVNWVNACAPSLIVIVAVLLII